VTSVLNPVESMKVTALKSTSRWGTFMDAIACAYESRIWRLTGEIHVAGKRHNGVVPSVLDEGSGCEHNGPRLSSAKDPGSRGGFAADPIANATRLCLEISLARSSVQASLSVVGVNRHAVYGERTPDGILLRNDVLGARGWARCRARWGVLLSLGHAGRPTEAARRSGGSLAELVRRPCQDYASRVVVRLLTGIPLLVPRAPLAPSVDPPASVTVTARRGSG
jgi:hypothetical protein